MSVVKINLANTSFNAQTTINGMQALVGTATQQPPIITLISLAIMQQFQATAHLYIAEFGLKIHMVN